MKHTKQHQSQSSFAFDVVKREARAGSRLLLAYQLLQCVVEMAKTTTIPIPSAYQVLIQCAAGVFNMNKIC